MTNNDIIISSQIYEKNKDLIKNNGVIFTPHRITKHIIKNSKIKITNTVTEPSIGKGIFLFTILNTLLENNNINDVVYWLETKFYGFDINDDFIFELKENIKIFFKNIGYDNDINLNNIKCENYLLYNHVKTDYTIGNPPYIKIQNIDKKLLEIYKKKYKSISKGNIDLYFAFVEKSLKISKNILFIIPNVFIKSKSGKILRNLLSSRIDMVFDFGTKKIFNGIGTYTCIISCKENNNGTFKYNKKTITIKNNNWILSSNDISKLKGIINNTSVSIQTSADKYFLVKDFDDEYGYINNHKIELSFCKKIISATTSKKFSDYFYVLYPYDNNNVVIPETIIENNYPLAYKYLLSNKDILIKRNMNGVWYEFGRTQGLIKKQIGQRYILPNIFSRKKGLHYIKIPDNENVLILKGLYIDVNDEKTFLNIISSDEFSNYLENTNPILPGTNNDIWIKVSTTSLKKY